VTRSPIELFWTAKDIRREDIISPNLQKYPMKFILTSGNTQQREMEEKIAKYIPYMEIDLHNERKCKM